MIKDKEWTLLQSGDVEGPSGIVFPDGEMRSYATIVESIAERINDVQDSMDTMFEATAVALAKWFFETYGEVAEELGYLTYASEFGNDSNWDDYPDDYPQKQILCALAKKLLTVFIQYNSDIITGGAGSQENNGS